MFENIKEKIISTSEIMISKSWQHELVESSFKNWGNTILTLWLDFSLITYDEYNQLNDLISEYWDKYLKEVY